MTLPVYKIYGRVALGSVLCFSLSAIFSAISIFIPVLFSYNGTEESLTRVGGVFFFIIGWSLISYIAVKAIRGPAFFERSPRFIDTLRWKKAVLKKDIGEKLFGLESFDAEKLVGPPPKGTIKIDIFKSSGVIEKDLPLGNIFFIYGHNSHDIRYFTYHVVASHENPFVLFICFDQPAWSLLNFDKLKDKFGDWILDKKFWFADVYTGLYGLSEIASLREWDLKKFLVKGKKVDISKNVLVCSDIHTLHKRIREFREICDKEAGGTSLSNNRIVFVHDNVNLFTEAEKDIVYYVTHAAPLERQVGWIDIFTLDERVIEEYPLLFSRLYQLADVVVKLSEESNASSMKKYFRIEKNRWGAFNPSKIEFTLDLDENSKRYVQLVEIK